MEKTVTTFATDPFDYKGATASEIGYGNEVTETLFEDYIAQDGRQIGVFVAQPLKYGAIKANAPELTVIMPASHDYRLEPLWMRRMEIMATKMDAQVIGVDMPGTSGLGKASTDGVFETYSNTEKLPNIRQTLPEYLGALGGDFRLHANDQLDAIDKVVGLGSNKRYAIFGESMGAAVATDMISLMKERDLQVSDVILYELVNAFKGIRPQLPIRLMKVLPGTENDRRNEYITENSEIGHPMTAFELSGTNDGEKTFNQELDSARKKLSQQGAASVINGFGMMRGRLNSLSAGLALYGQKAAPQITLVRGRDSLAANGTDYMAFRSVFEARGNTIESVEVTDRSDRHRKIGHSHLVSLGRQTQVADELKHRIS